MKRKICVVTGSRAEYGLLFWLMKEIQKDADLELQLIVTGAHLSPEFGMTVNEIEKDFRIDAKIDIVMSSDTPVSISKSMGLANISFAEAYQRLQPDIIVVLGDRYEIFSAVSSALVSRIPIAHIHGGEVTVGAFDDAFRHSITKMSHLHFTSEEEYRNRVIQLGENPERVYNVGSLGTDYIQESKLLKKEELDINFGEKNLLVVFHPVTLEDDTTEYQFGCLLSALSDLHDTKIIFTRTNADTDGRIINQFMNDYFFKNPNKVELLDSVDRSRYLSIMQYVDGIVGNSSSGLTEAPYFRIGTINIGDRQTGRIISPGVINCEPTVGSIRRAIELLYSDEFQEILKTMELTYDEGNTAESITNVLKETDLTGILKKEFYDL